MFSSRLLGALVGLLWCSAALAQVPMTGAGNSSPSGGGACSAWTTVSARGSPALSTSTYAAALQTFICGLVSDGTYSLFEEIHVAALDTQAFSLLDLGQYNYTATATTTAGSGLTFTAGAGWSFPTPADGYVSSTMNLSTSHKYTQNSASLLEWLENTSGGANCTIGAVAGGTLDYNVAYGGSNTISQINAGTAVSVATPAGIKGLYGYDRSSSTAVAIYYDGATFSGSTGTIASTGIDNSAFSMMACQGGSAPNLQTFAFFAAGTSLGATNEASVYTRVHTLLHSINATNFP